MTSVTLSGLVVFDSALYLGTVFTNDGSPMWVHRNSMNLEHSGNPYGVFCAI